MRTVLKFGKILLNGQINEKDVLIESNKITKISENIFVEKDFKVINCKNKLIIPSFVNTHTHLGMSIFRGTGDGLPLMEWLEKKIWPVEAKLTEEDVYFATRFSIIELIKSGTTCFVDMYWHFNGVIRAVNDSGVRAFPAQTVIDSFDEKKASESIKLIKNLYVDFLNGNKNDKISFSLNPHAIYTVSEGTLKFFAEFAREHKLLLQIHLSETEQEVKDCIKKTGLRPVEYLEKLDFFRENKVILAHGVWVNEKEINILKKYDVAIAHNPISNMKLGVGGKFPFSEYKRNNIVLTLGTDSVSSNNSLDLFETMKFASLLTKHNTNDALTFAPKDAFLMSTKNVYEFLGLNAGEVKEGKLADLLIIDLEHYSMIPSIDIISNLVYSAKSEAIDTVICNGEIIMQNRVVKDEELVRKKMEEITKKLIKN
jgi:5-methylthioadenosine/S-adenosylhomocysteine deaminase